MSGLGLKSSTSETSTLCSRTATAAPCAAGRSPAPGPVKFVGDWDDEADENVLEAVTLTYDFSELVQ